NIDTGGEFPLAVAQPDSGQAGSPRQEKILGPEQPRRIRHQCQHSCYEGQSSEPQIVNLGRRGMSRPLIRLQKISPLRLTLRNRGRFEVVVGSSSLDLASGASSLAHSAKSWPSSLPLVT